LLSSGKLIASWNALSQSTDTPHWLIVFRYLFLAPSCRPGRADGPSADKTEADQCPPSGLLPSLTQLEHCSPRVPTNCDIGDFDLVLRTLILIKSAFLEGLSLIAPVFPKPLLRTT
jgi:hypothetical protein